MKRSMVIASAMVCALASSGVVSAQSVGFDRFGFEIRLGGGGGSFHTARELERAEARLHGARRAHQDAVWKLDAAAARHSAVARELESIDRQIAEHRGAEYELRRLHEQLDAAQREGARIEADLARLRSLAADADRALDAAREAHFRRAEGSALIIDARGRLEMAQQDLDRSRQWVLEQQLYPSVDWQRASASHDDASRRLAEAERTLAPADEIDLLRRDLSEAERRMEMMVANALSREATVRAAESRLADAQRILDAAWAQVERDLEHDQDFRRARGDAARLSADAARADNALYKVRDETDRLHRDIDRVRQIQYAINVRELEHRAGVIRRDASILASDVHGARQCLTQAECELRDAQFAYDAAYSAHLRCVAEERSSISIRIEHRDGPKHDSRERRDDDDREGRHGDSRRDDDDRARRSGSGPDDRVARSSGDQGSSATGTYRDRGERYERARGNDSDRQRTRG